MVTSSNRLGWAMSNPVFVKAFRLFATPFCYATSSNMLSSQLEDPTDGETQNSDFSDSEFEGAQHQEESEAEQ
jgi:hypothetical protein